VRVSKNAQWSQLTEGHGSFSRLHSIFCFHQLKVDWRQKNYTIRDILSFGTTVSLISTHRYQGKTHPAAQSSTANWTLATERTPSRSHPTRSDTSPELWYIGPAICERGDVRREHRFLDRNSREGGMERGRTGRCAQGQMWQSNSASRSSGDYCSRPSCSRR
jgi:hypothetical protein